VELRLYEAGKPEGARAVDERRTLGKGALAIGGEGAAIAVPGLGAGAAVEVVLERGAARIRRVGGGRVSVGGREVAEGAAVDLPPETLLSIDGKDLVLKREGAADEGGPDSERPSVMARDVLKQVFSALGVPEGDQPALVVYDQDEKQVKRIDLSGEEVTIGRDAGNRLALYHASVSKNHARVVRDALGWLVYDLESRNGVEVNGAPVKGKQRLKSGDRIRIGQFSIRFVDPKAATADLSASMPDLKKLEKAKPGEPVEVGDKAGAADVHETQTQLRPSQKIAAAPTPQGGSGGATGATGGGPGAGAAAAPGGPAAGAPGEAPAAGSNTIVYALVGVGVVILVAAVVLIVLASSK
jgi:pSer/pThr/pTyr-binding forkhead associated (FHA) protein